MANFLYAWSIVDEFHDQAVRSPVSCDVRSHNSPAILHLQHGIHRVVQDVQEHLLQLVGIGRYFRQVLGEFAVHNDVIGAQIVFPQRERIFQNLIQLHRQALGLVLARETQQVVHDAVRALRLLVNLLDVLRSLGAQGLPRSQQLPVSQNRRQGIVQFVSHSGD